MKITAPIPFAGSQIDQTRHVCAFFHSPDEEYRVLLPFIKDGFQSGHKAIHVVNQDQRQDHLQRLTAAGIDTAAVQQSGQLEIRTDTDVYLPEGRFDADRMISAFEQLASGNGTGEFPLSRICCRMDWAVERGSDLDDVIEFESRVNEVWHRHDDAVICTYHLGKFGGDAVLGHLANPSDGRHRRLPATKSLLYATRRIPAGISRATVASERLSRGGLTWQCRSKLGPRRSNAFSAALTIW